MSEFPPDKYYQQIPQSFNKTAAYSNCCPLRHPARSLGHWYTAVYLRIFDPETINPTNLLGALLTRDYRQSIESPMGVPTVKSTEATLTFTIFDCVLRLRPTKVLLYTNYTIVDIDY